MFFNGILIRKEDFKSKNISPNWTDIRRDLTKIRLFQEILVSYLE